MSRTIRIRRGLDVPFASAPQQVVHPGQPIRQVALCGLDYVGLRPRLLVEVGATVALGQPLLEDRRDPAVCYASPGSGTIVAVNRGARRALHSIVLRLGEPAAEELRFEALSAAQIEALDRAAIVRRLLASGLWTAFRSRPYSRVPPSASAPRAIFVTAIDTRPLAPDPAVIVQRDAASFGVGLQLLTRLTAGTVWLCTAPGWPLAVPPIGRLQQVAFSGPHPAGLAGTHMHFLDPVGPGRTAWQIGYQDVTAIGKLFRTGRIDTSRIVALAGSGVARPRLVETRLGASLHELLDPADRDGGDRRLIAGSVLDGRSASGATAFLGRYHDQVCLVGEGGRSELFGWAGWFGRRFTVAGLFAHRARPRRRWPFDTAQNGRFCGMLPLGVFEQVMPLDILPAPLLRALLVCDSERARELGCLELDEEDLALCSFVCPAKQDYGAALRINLDQLGREG